MRRKTKAPTEFGVKFEAEIDERGYGRMVRSSFNAYNESTTLKEALNRYKEHEGHYPKPVLADQIYRTNENRKICKENGIRKSGPKPGRPSKDREERS